MYFRLVDIDGEASIANWYSSMKLFLIGALFLVLALDKIKRERPSSWLLVGFPLVFFAMSADEVVQFHEWLGWRSDMLLPGDSREGTHFQATGIWMFVIALPFFALLLTASLAMRRYFLPGRGFLSKILAGIGVLAGGAAGVEFLANLVPESETLGFHIQVFAEELLEMWGASLILWGVSLILVSGSLSFIEQFARFRIPHESDEIRAAHHEIKATTLKGNRKTGGKTRSHCNPPSKMQGSDEKTKAFPSG
jgi:hypothetical protein